MAAPPTVYKYPKKYIPSRKASPRTKRIWERHRKLRGLPVKPPQLKN